MPATIRLLADWGLYPFWIDYGDGKFDAVDPDFFQEYFDLPDQVMCALLSWDKIYQDVLDWDDPGGSDWSSPEAEQRYVEQGRDAARLLRAHIPADVKIRYVAADNIAPEYH